MPRNSRGATREPCSAAIRWRTTNDGVRELPVQDDEESGPDIRNDPQPEEAAADSARRPARGARGAVRAGQVHSQGISSVAMPSRLKNPTMSVTVVSTMDDDCAGS